MIFKGAYLFKTPINTLSLATLHASSIAFAGIEVNSRVLNKKA
ncbi:secreted protein [Candidatus Magnetoovum chiemensis]|nr:secreted protein [Candidatus Magnetoovum chiemensis]